MEKKYVYQETIYRIPVATHWVALITLILLCTAGLLKPTSAQAQSGKVFRDFNGNGIQDAGEPLVSGIVVKAYNTTGVLCASVVSTTSAAPNYTLLTTCSGQVRVEFEIPATTANLAGSVVSIDYTAGSGGIYGSSVQFVAAGATNVNLAINNPEDYCQTNPKMIIPCYENGSGTGNTNPVLVSLDYTGTGAGQNTYPTNVNADRVGSTWGVAYQKDKQLAYVSAFLKRQSGLGDRGLDGIYVVDHSTATPTLAGGFDLEGVVPANGGGAISFGSVTRVLVASGAGSNVNELSADRTQASRDDDAYAKVGKAGYGAIDIDQATSTLWAVNLNERSLVAVDISSALQSTTIPNAVASAKVKRYFINGTTTPFITGLPACPSGTMRPFGLKLYKGVGYLGVVCDGSALSTVDMTAAQQAYVLSFNPTNPTAFTQVTSVPLNYTREQGWVPFSPTATFDALESDKWQRWVDTYTDPSTFGSSVVSTNQDFKTGINGVFVGAPQPILADMEFLPNGDLVLGFMDRFAHQQGWLNYIPGSSQIRSAVSQGDILLGSLAGSTYSFEGPNENDNFTTPPVAVNAQPGQLLNDGPSGAGEFFYQDYFIGADATHPETALGGLALLPGSNEITAVSFDPAAFNSMGIRWLNTTTGYQNRVYTIVANTNITNFGKGSGLGDAELLCNPAPLEIGNRVWNDTDSDGIQDAGEVGIANVTIELYADFNNDGTPDGTALATVQTSASGTWYFNSANITDGDPSITGNQAGLAPNRTYLVRVGSADWAGGIGIGDLANLALTTSNATSAGLPDVSDNDAVLASAIPTIAYTTGAYGQNNHTLDIGFKSSLCAITLIPTVSGCYNTTAGSRATISVEVSWTNSPPNDYIVVTAGAQSRTIVPGPYTSSGGNGAIESPQVVTFEVAANAATGTITAAFVLTATCAATKSYTAPAACPPTLCNAGANQTGGTVFNDYDADGIMSAGETTGLAGITVRAFDCKGQLVATATTDAYGTYAFTGLTAASYPIRVEFSNLPALYAQGTLNGSTGRTTVQFVAAPACGINLGVSNPNDYCQTNAKVIIPCYVNGNPLVSGTAAAGNDPAIIGFTYGRFGGVSSGTVTVNDNDHYANASQVGSLWSVAYNKFTNKAYTSATLKRHVGLGPLGLGGIYVINMATGSTTNYVDVTAAPLNVNVGQSQVPNNAARGLSGNKDIASADSLAFALIGKVGIGGMDISEDGKFLFFTNLFDKKIYKLDITGATPTLAGSYAIPDPGCVNGIYRPYALKIKRNSVYVGAVCDGTTTNSKADMRAYIYAFDQTTSTFNATPVIDFPLTYPKGRVDNSAPNNTGWYPWTDKFNDLVIGSNLIHPQPIFADLDFDIDGSLVLGFGDRTGLQGGINNFRPSGTGSYAAYTGGDILRAVNLNGVFILENNAKVGSLTGWGANNNEGPGFGEFYHDGWSDFLFGGDYLVHSENTMGGLAIRPGSGQTISTEMDPVNARFGGTTFSGGVRYFSNTTGDFPQNATAGLVIYRGFLANGVFGKATGLGDVELACGLPQYVEIGNRVWRDDNADGVQDPCEPPLVGVTVSLYQNGTLVATTTTNASGEYYFNNNPVSSTVVGTGVVSTTALLPNTAYQLVFGSTQFASNVLTLSGTRYLLTLPNSTTTNANDQNDSDALVTTVAGITAPVISLTSPAAGAVNHTYDVGFYQPATLGDFVFEDVNANGQQEIGIDKPIQGVVVTLVSNGTVVATTTTSASGLYSFTGLTPGKPYSVSFTTPAGFTATTPNTGNDATDSDPVGGITGVYTLTAGENNPTVDAGFYQPASLGDFVFIDLDKNGVQSSGDVPVPGLLVTLFLNGSAIATTTTDGAGLYSFSGLTPGTANNYSVGFATPNGYTATTTNTGSNSAVDSDLIAATGRTASLTLSSGQSNTSIDAGFVCKLLTTLTATVSSPSVCLGTSVGLTALISPAGSYTYAWSGPAGVVITNAGSASATASSLHTGLNTFTVTVTTTPYCSTFATVSVTVNPVPTTTLSSTTICANQPATLTATGGTSYTLNPGNVVNTSGLFTLTPSGTTSYTVTAANASGCKATATGTVTVNPLPTPTLTSATICAGQTGTLTATGGVSYTLAPGNVVNTSGLFTLTPSGTTTYTVTASNATGCLGVTTASITVNPQPVVMVLNTSCNGSTTYTVNFSATAGANITASAGTVTGNQVLNVPSGTSLTITATLGLCNATASVSRDCASNVATLGNNVFIDSNANGIQDGGDLPLPGVLVTLLSNGNVVGTTTTDGSGIYSFTGLVPGVFYSVSFATPTGYSATTQQAPGSTDVNDSDASLLTGQTRSVTLAAGENNIDLDAGFVKLRPTYAIAKTVNLKQVELGQLVTYTVSLTNTSAITATSLVLTDQFSSTAVTLVGSATTSVGIFVAGPAGGSWTIPSLAGGQVATLSFQVQLNESGITYNTVTGPDGQTATVCTSVPFRVCSNETFEFLLSVPNSYSAYQWSRNGQPIPGATSSTLSATAVGEYTVTANGIGSCPSGECCPFSILTNPAPSLTALAQAATCVGVTPQANAAIRLVASSPEAVSYNITTGSSFTVGTPLFATPQALSAVTGGILLGSQPNPLTPQDYTVRVYAATGCFSDTVVTILPAVCTCPPQPCAPFVVTKTKSQGKVVVP